MVIDFPSVHARCNFPQKDVLLPIDIVLQLSSIQNSTLFARTFCPILIMLLSPLIRKMQFLNKEPFSNSILFPLPLQIILHLIKIELL